MAKILEANDFFLSVSLPLILHIFAYIKIITKQKERKKLKASFRMLFDF
jgi:hypothetical protein